MSTTRRAEQVFVEAKTSGKWRRSRGPGSGAGQSGYFQVSDLPPGR
jgi:hypothetical protein